MATAEMCERFERVISLPNPASHLDDLVQAVADITRLEAWLASTKTWLLSDMAVLSPAAENMFATAANLSLNQTNRVLERANTLTPVSAVAVAFQNGDWSAAHVDAFLVIYRRSTSEVQAKLVEHADELVAFGSSSTVDELRKRAAALAHEFEGPEDAEERLVRQKKATRLTFRVDPATGMGHLSGWFDPETYLSLHGQIIRETQARFHDLTPEHCPLEPVERQQFLRAHALIGLLNGTRVAAAGGGPEIVVVHHQPAGDMTVEWPIAGLELPDSSLDRILANRARIFNIAVRNGDIIYAPGDLNLGRKYRLANKAQRRALAAVHATCAVPGCEVRYWQTKLHHIQFWEHGGLTDLNNLIPLCARHHTRLHADNWKCELRAGRQVTFTLPDGTILANAPPHTRVG
jgi:hypothetical protein